MQQTEKYQFNLIETGDTFSPDPLNGNMEKVEEAITAEAAALLRRIQVLEGHKIVTGHAEGGGTETLGVTPKAVVAFGTTSGGGSALAVPGYYSNSSVKIVSGGFSHTNYLSECNYIAIL